jgi:tetratricopeptide (TPR) repeat protein
MPDYTPFEAPVRDPQYLPVAVPSKLVGRDVLLAKIYSDLKKNDAVLVYGDGGVGKTALAATLASAYSELPGGVIWLSVDDTPLTELVVRIARAYKRLDIANSDQPLSYAGEIKALLDQHKPLIVFDGDSNPRAVRDFVAQMGDETPLLITAEQPIDGDWANIELPELNDEQAVALFQHLADSDEDAYEVVETLGGNPFVIAVAAGTIKANKQTAADFLATLPKAAGVMPPMALLVLTSAFRGLPNALQGLMLMLGATFKGQGSGELLSMVSGAPVEGVNQALSMLVNRQLVERYTVAGSAYYRLHPLVKDFAESWLRGSQRLEPLQAKVRDSVVAYASRFASQPAKLSSEMATFLATAQWAADEDDLDTPNQLAVSIMQAGGFVKDYGYTQELMTLRKLAASTAAAPAPFPAYQNPLPTPAPDVIPPMDHALDDEFDDEIDEALDDEFDDELLDGDEDEFDDDLDDDADDLDEDLPITRQVPMPLDEDDEEEVLPPIEMGEMARLRATLMQARQQGDQRREAATLKEIAALQLADGMEIEALSSYAEALTHYEAVNDRGEMLNVLQALAETELKTDNLQAAALHAARGAALADQLGELTRQALLSTILGDARQQLGESEPAIRAYEQALTLVRSADDARSEAVLLFKLGYAQLDNSDPEAASETWETALKMFKEQGRRDYEGRVLGGLGTVYGDMERWMESVNFHTSALYIAREVKDRREEALQLSNLGYASVQARQLGQAVLRYRQALHLAYESDDRDDIVSTTVELANVLIQSPRHLLITELIVDEALEIDPSDRDLRKLRERITTDKVDAEARGVAFIPVDGSAQDYAENAYELLDEA